MHDFLASVQHCIQALEVLGFKYPRSNAAILGRLMKTINTIKRILKSDEMTRQQISKRYTTKNFIAAFKDIAQSDTESRAHQIVLSEVIMVSELLTKSLILLRPNIEILFAITQLTILSENILDNRDLLLGSCYARCVPVFGVLHFSKSYSRCDARSKVLLMDLELIVENITAESATYLGFIHEARNLECLREGNMFQACLHQRSFVNILDRVGLNYTETGYAIRCRYHSTEITLGNYQNYADAIDKDSSCLYWKTGKSIHWRNYGSFRHHMKSRKIISKRLAITIQNVSSTFACTEVPRILVL
ncbi:hypothetical protein BCR33DRAFT_19902 [Rhizoclosmatium globosum]|uniref:Uncharacterized protein n=1 Tax=Rhizoclosmatium globosum TaxID=329046 RepID=A0A1Y2CQ35_9FUNG|nr:hypothetical protein BCR33DRAFT_19902 [Rhizoclosmatium globosum]|eukprot:ORY49149.1 hypothetical protein BCR33DRAFT_19902 [Rhizoclosmatium globosum]